MQNVSVLHYHVGIVLGADWSGRLPNGAITAFATTHPIGLVSSGKTVANRSKGPNNEG